MTALSPCWKRITQVFYRLHSCTKWFQSGRKGYSQAMSFQPIAPQKSLCRLRCLSVSQQISRSLTWTDGGKRCEPDELQVHSAVWRPGRRRRHLGSRRYGGARRLGPTWDCPIRTTTASVTPPRSSRASTLLDGIGFSATGLVGSVAVAGEANEIAVEGSILQSTGQTAYAATGS